jgi:hypothetical protein
MSENASLQSIDDEDIMESQPQSQPPQADDQKALPVSAPQKSEEGSEELKRDSDDEYKLDPRCAAFEVHGKTKQVSPIRCLFYRLQLAYIFDCFSMVRHLLGWALVALLEKASFGFTTIRMRTSSSST